MAPERTKQLVLGLVPLVVGVVLLLQGDGDVWVAGAVAVVGLLLLAVLARRGRHTAWRAAAPRLASVAAVVLWKPGCVYCERMLLALRGDPRVVWVNVWADREANAEVRRHNGGDELTPTVLIGDEVLRNPGPDEVRERLETGAL